MCEKLLPFTCKRRPRVPPRGVCSSPPPPLLLSRTTSEKDVCEKLLPFLFQFLYELIANSNIIFLLIYATVQEKKIKKVDTRINICYYTCIQ